MGRSKVRELLKRKRSNRKKHCDTTLQSSNAIRKGRRKFKESSVPEDKVIHEMERLLGIKKKNRSKLSSEFTMDGLDYVLNFLSDSDNDDGSQSSHDNEQYETAKAAKHSLNDTEEFSVEQQTEKTKKGNKRVKFNLSPPIRNRMEGDSPVVISDSSKPEQGNKVVNTEHKYSVLQKRDSSLKPNLDSLQRKIRGLINRLSESNLSGIMSQLEQMYSVNSRNDINSVLTDVVLKASIQPILLSNKMAMEHTMLIALLHSSIGTEVGAYFVEEIVKTFDRLYNIEQSSKECGCTVLLLAHLYTFKVIHCVLIYDIIRKLLESFTETDIELLVLLLKECGMEIRKDDPSSLKEIIKQIQSKASTQSIAAQSSRVKFMLEVIGAIKTNNSHKIPNYDPELKLHMRKLLRGLGRTPGTVMNESNQLKLPLRDLLEAGSRGRWWIIGSSWTGRMKETTPTSNEANDDTVESSEILELAREQRMSTDIRKNIFCLIMTSEDYIDAFTKLIRLKLKSAQDREIVHVLLDCCLQENTFNLFYVYLGQKFCDYHRNHQVTFQYGIWDKLKSLDSLNRIQLSNLCQFLIHMIYNKALSVSILRIVEFSELNQTGVSFYCSLFRNLLLKMNNDQTRTIFSRAHQSKSFLSNLCVFIRQYLSNAKFNDQCEIIEQCLKLSI